MNQEPNKIDFDDRIQELNYNDYKERFPKIIGFYKLVHEYQNAPNVFVPTDGQEVYPGTRYKQNDVATDWRGSWKHIADAFLPIDQTLRELLIYYGKKVKDGLIVPDGADEFIPKDRTYFYYNTGNPYIDFYVNDVFPWRNYYDKFNNANRDYLLKYEPIFEKAMIKFSEENGENFKEVTQARVERDLLSKTIGTMTGNEFFELLKGFLEKNNFQIVNKAE